MDPKRNQRPRRTEWFTRILVISLFCIHVKCDVQTLSDETSRVEETKINLDRHLEPNCHSYSNSQIDNLNVKEFNDKIYNENFMGTLIDSVSSFCEKYVFVNNTERKLSDVLESAIDEVLKNDRYEVLDGVEIRSVSVNGSDSIHTKDDSDARALFSSYTYEYRLFKKVKDFIDTHILSINLPKAARVIGFRSFGLKKFFLPILIGMQVFKSILLAMFLPSILGSFGKILGKGISHISAASSQASYPPANADDQLAYNNENKDYMGYETNQAGMYALAQEYGNMETSDANDLANVDMSRFGASGQKVSYLPTKNSYYKNQMTNNYKMFHKIPVSSMILSNYDPFYSPLLSRLDGIFARLGLAPTESSAEDAQQPPGAAQLEACREQLICLMYANPAKYAPYSNLVSAQLSRELNELRRPVSDNPEILRFFRYMRSARHGQEGVDCAQATPACVTHTSPTHTMIAAYHDINKLVSARKFH